MVDEAFDFFFVGDEDCLFGVESREDVSHFVDLFCCESVGWFVEDYDVFCFDLGEH